MKHTIKIETRWHTGQLLQPELIRTVYWCGKNILGLSVTSLRMITETTLDPKNCDEVQTVGYALVSFEVEDGVVFDCTTLYDPDEHAPGVIVTEVI